MPAESASFAELSARFDALGSADRKAVLAKMSAEERAAYSAAAARRSQAQKDEADRMRKADRQFAPYSAWLGELIERAVKRSDLAGGAMTETTIRAIGEIHANLRDEQPSAPPMLWERIQQLIIGPLPALPSQAGPRITRGSGREGPR